MYGPMKRYYNDACNSWQLRNAGKTMTIYEVAEMAGQAIPRAFSPENITAGFRVTGIFPFNRHIFGDDEYLSSYVTDRAEGQDVEAEGQQTSETEEQQDGIEARQDDDDDDDDDAEKQLNTNAVERDANKTAWQQNSSTEGQKRNNYGEGLATDEQDPSHFSPEDVRPFPKAAARKRESGRKKRKTLILTATPVKKRLQKVEEERQSKKTEDLKWQKKRGKPES